MRRRGPRSARPAPRGGGDPRRSGRATPSTRPRRTTRRATGSACPRRARGSCRTSSRSSRRWSRGRTGTTSRTGRGGAATRTSTTPRSPSSGTGGSQTRTARGSAPSATRGATSGRSARPGTRRSRTGTCTRSSRRTGTSGTSSRRTTSSCRAGAVPTTAATSSGGRRGGTVHSPGGAAGGRLGWVGRGSPSLAPLVTQVAGVKVYPSDSVSLGLSKLSPASRAFSLKALGLSRGRGVVQGDGGLQDRRLGAGTKWAVAGRTAGERTRRGQWGKRPSPPSRRTRTLDLRRFGPGSAFLPRHLKEPSAPRPYLHPLPPLRLPRAPMTPHRARRVPRRRDPVCWVHDSLCSRTRPPSK